MASTPGIWVTDPEAYRKKLADFVGDRDSLEVLSASADVLDAMAKAHSPAQMRTRPFEGKWTPNEIIGHLLDAEWVYGYRMRLILGEDNPTILGMDQDLWVETQRHNERDPHELVAAFRAIRNEDLYFWKHLSAGDLDRAGQHNERGAETLGDILNMLAGHDLWHIDQIERYLAAVKRGS